MRKIDPIAEPRKWKTELSGELEGKTAGECHKELHRQCLAFFEGGRVPFPVKDRRPGDASAPLKRN